MPPRDTVTDCFKEGSETIFVFRHFSAEALEGLQSQQCGACPQGQGRAGQTSRARGA